MSKSRKRKPRASGSPQWMVAGSIGKVSKAGYEQYRSRGFYSGSTNSEVRRIDPETGLAVTIDLIEEAANAILKTGVKQQQQQPRPPKVRKPNMKAKNRKKTAVPPSMQTKDNFYKSWDWRTLRMLVIKEQGRACQCCGAQPGSRNAAGGLVRIQVDHIKPISKYWNLRLDRSNLQILCEECNQGKGNWDETDFRQPDEWADGPTDDIALDILASMPSANEVAA